MKRFLLFYSSLSCATLLAATSVSLNGAWKLDYFPQPNQGAVRCVPLPSPLNIQTVTASVPGNCELDLVHAGILPPLEIGLNILKLRPYEQYQWLYTKTFSSPAVDVSSGEKAVLVFDGIDTLADIFLNGEKVAETENMFITHRIDITDKVKPGSNTVHVLLRSVLLDSQYQSMNEIGNFNHSVGFFSYRKACHMGGWDILPRALVQGLWRSVRYDIEDPVRLRECVWITKDLDVKTKTARIQFRTRFEAPFASLDEAFIRCTLSRNGKVLAQAHNRAWYYHQDVEFTLNNVALWWPLGSGEQPLYDAVAEIVSKDGTVLARDARKIGFRKIELIRDDVYGPERPGQFLFKINDEPIYVRGSNWVPLDALHARDNTHLIPTLEMFKDLNCNMVRVWGGGVYESDAFFDWCDENGLMVWQDFMQACNAFPQDDDYARKFHQEVKSEVLRLRNHASLILWSGNNENDNAFVWGIGKKLARNPNQDRSSRQVIPNVLFEYDVTRPYLPSSPYWSPDVVAGKAHPSEDHLWGVRAYYKVPFYTNSPCWFASEMGYHGCPNLSSIKRMMTPDHVYPWTKITGDNPKKDYHWNDEWLIKAVDENVHPRFIQRKHRNFLMTNQAKLMFGSVETNLTEFVDQSQFVQMEAMKYFCEMFRSRKFTRFNGLIWWNVRDGWPVLSDAVCDYYGGKKPAYYALKNVQQNQLCMLGDDHKAWAINDSLFPVKGHVKYWDEATGRVLLERDYEVARNSKTLLGEIPFTGQGLIHIAYTVDHRSYKNHYLYGEIPFKWSDIKKWTRQTIFRVHD